MYKKKEFNSVLEAIRYVKEKDIATNNLMYIASKDGTCELVFKLR